MLSNPAEKVKFDGELRRYVDGRTSGSGGGTFWTMCPYCYFVYEYDRAFEDCCLKCSNMKCRRVLHAVAIGGPPPPPDVVEKGQYCCPGFMPFGIRGSNGEAIVGDKLWVPFAPAHSVGKGLDLNNSASSAVLYNETVEGNNKKGDDGRVGEVRVKVKRKKSVPWKSKKLMGRGVSINGDEAHFVYGVEECHSIVEVSEPSFLRETVDELNGGVEFLEGDDDVFISLPSDFDLENGGAMIL